MPEGERQYPAGEGPTGCINEKEVATLERWGYQRMNEEGRGFVAEWARRGRIAGQNGSPFEGFIFTWMALNAWANFVAPTKSDSPQDRQWVERVARDEHFETAFQTLRQEADCAERFERFNSRLPIFQAGHLERLRDRDPEIPQVMTLVDRAALRPRLLTHFLESEPNRPKHEPRCFTRHAESGGVPRDWAHTLVVIYQIRCNLFHGNKYAGSEVDTALVEEAFYVLAAVVEREGSVYDKVR